MIEKSQLPRYLLKLAARLNADGDEDSGALVCQMAAGYIPLLEGIIIGDPVEIQIEEGDRANG